MNCPVCCHDAPLRDGNVLGHHTDGLGMRCVMVGHELPPWDERSTTAVVYNRSGHICENCQRARATERHHRKSRGVGGLWTPANIIHLCHGCHRWVTHQPSLAYQLGLMLHSHDDAETVPVTRQDGSLFQPTSDVTRGGLL